MRKILCAVLAMILLVCTACACAEGNTAITLDDYIDNHNAAMEAIGFDADSYISRADIPVESGDVNDTFIFSIYNNPESFVMLILEKETEKVLGAVAYLTHTGYEGKAPAALLEYLASIAYGTGFLAMDDSDGVLYLMQDLGLYSSTAFAYGNASSLLNADGTMQISYSCDETTGIFLTVSPI